MKKFYVKIKTNILRQLSDSYTSHLSIIKLIIMSHINSTTSVQLLSK